MLSSHNSKRIWFSATLSLRAVPARAQPAAEPRVNLVAADQSATELAENSKTQ